MRLRSSQFVFLMLLICSVQVREECAWHLREGSVSTRSATISQHRDAASRSARQLTRIYALYERLAPAMGLSSADLDLHRAPWTVPSPAREFTAIASHTSFLRA